MYDLADMEDELRMCGDYLTYGLVKNTGVEERCADPWQYDRHTGLLK